MVAGSRSYGWPLGRTRSWPRSTFPPRRGADPSLDALALAMPRRHTNRLPFVSDPIPRAAIDALAAAATAEGATLDAASDGARARIIRLIQAADAGLGGP